MDQSALHIEARQHADLRRWQGYVLDKKQLRWNDIVAVGMFYADCAAVATMQIAMSGVREAVDACGREVRSTDIIGPCQSDRLYICGGSVLTMIHAWMIPDSTTQDHTT